MNMELTKAQREAIRIRQEILNKHGIRKYTMKEAAVSFFEGTPEMDLAKKRIDEMEALK